MNEPDGESAAFREIEQSQNVSDEALVELVENAIRSNPQDFPLLTKYYLDAA